MSGLFEHDERGVPWLRGSYCPRCGEHVFPQRAVCPRCRARTMEPKRLGRTGRVYSFTVSHVAPAGLKAPYLQTFVELAEGPRVFSLVSDAVEPRIDALDVGQRMELVIEPMTDGDGELVYKYRPARGA